MSKRYDELFGEIVDILRHDWAGAELAGDQFDPRYYNMAVGQAWHDQKLDELLFLQYMNQMLACTGDRHLRLTRRPSETYTPWQPGFFARRYGNSLYVTAAEEETRLRPGDRIDTINGGTPEKHRRNIQKNFFYSNEPEREDWRGLIRMADEIGVVHPDGREERLTIWRLPVVPPVQLPARVRCFSDGVIIDVRNLPDLDEDEQLSLLSLVCREDTQLSALVDTDLYVNYTRRNCFVKTAALQGLDGAEEFIAELSAKAGKGYLPESVDDGYVIPGRADSPVVVLTDTWTRDGAESFALAAKRAGAHLMGRPTLGTIDLCGDVSCELDERFILTWPTAVTAAARNGRGVFGHGVEPDCHVPWTPAECTSDVLMRAAEEYLVERKSEL